MADAIDNGEWLSDQLRSTYKKFGDLRTTDFATWWGRVGFQLFAEEQDFKSLTMREPDQQTGNNTLVIEIPLTVSPMTLKEQFNALLREHHPHFKKFDRWEMSTANTKLKSSRLTSLSINLYLSVYEKQQALLANNDNVTLYEVGEALALNPKLTVTLRDLPNEAKDKHLQMSLLVSEYLEKAKNLIAYASEGIFPCTENHHWIERSTRAPSDRFRIAD